MPLPDRAMSAYLGKSIDDIVLTSCNLQGRVDTDNRNLVKTVNELRNTLKYPGAYIENFSDDDIKDFIVLLCTN